MLFGRLKKIISVSLAETTLSEFGLSSWQYILRCVSRLQPVSVDRQSVEYCQDEDELHKQTELVGVSLLDW